MTRGRLSFLIALSVALAASPLGHSQADYSTATVKGTVLDPQRLFIAGAEVVIKNPSTGFSRTVRTGADGEYRFPLLAPGNYEIQAEAQGFARAVGSLSLSVGETLTYDFHLEVGTTSAVIQVSGEAPLVQLEQTQQANTIDTRQVGDLPNLDRDFTYSVFTLPGVAKSEAPRSQNPGFSGFQSSGFSIGGSNGRNNLVTIDGGENDYGSGQLRTPNVPIDSIQEFQVNRSSFAAEFGFTSGTAVNMVTRSGTNQYHGSVYSLFRNESTDAANYFSPHGPNKPFEQNFVAGVTFGGPIIKNKLFVFTAYEWVKNDTPQFRSYSTSATAQPFSSNPAQISYVNQLVASKDPNLLPIAGLLQYILTPANFPITGQLLDPNSGVFNDYKKFSNWVTRIDYSPSSNDTITGRFSLMNEDFSRMYVLDPLNSWDDATLENWRDYTLLGSWSHVFSPRLLNQLRIQVVPSDYANVPVVSPNTAYLALGSLGNFQGEHYEPYAALQRRFQFEDSLTWTKGHHTFKFGGSYRPVSYKVNDQLWMRGEFDFYDGAIPLTAPLSELLPPPVLEYLATSAVGLPGPATGLSALQSYDLGAPVAFRQGFGNPNWQGWGQNLGFFAQDSWKVNSSFSLDFGGRVDYSDEASPIPHHVFFSPRVGFAWSPGASQKTVIRGGGGMFVAPIPFYNDYILNLLGGSGQYINQFATSITQVDPHTGLPIPVELWLYGEQAGKLPFGHLTQADLAGLGYTIPSQTNQVVVKTNPGFENVYSIQASLGIQRELARNLSLEVAYQFYHGLHEQFPYDTNVAEVPCAAGVDVAFVGPCYTQINPQYAQIETYSSTGSSVYNGATVSLTRKFANGLQFQANYTYSRAIDDNTDFNNNFMPFRPTRLDLERGLSAFNITHNFVASAVYATPFKPGGNALSRVLADVTLSPVLALRTGIPFTIRVPGLENGTLGEFLYARPWAAGRNTGIGPDFYGFDMRVSKALYLSRDRGIKFDLIAEGTNILNHPNFSAVNDQFPANQSFALPGGGTLQNGPYHIYGYRSSDPTQPLAFKSAFDARQLQFGLKLTF